VPSLTFATLERALGEAGLDPYVVGGRGFWSQQQIEDLRCLLQVISNPLDDEPCSAPSPLPSPRCSRTPSGCCARPPRCQATTGAIATTTSGRWSAT